jgi:hypothetical protein
MFDMGHGGCGSRAARAIGFPTSGVPAASTKVWDQRLAGSDSVLPVFVGVLGASPMVGIKGNICVGSVGRRSLGCTRMGAVLADSLGMVVNSFQKLSFEKPGPRVCFIGKARWDPGLSFLYRNAVVIVH